MFIQSLSMDNIMKFTSAIKNPRGLLYVCLLALKDANNVSLSGDTRVVKECTRKAIEMTQDRDMESYLKLLDSNSYEELLTHFESYSNIDVALPIYRVYDECYHNEYIKFFMEKMVPTIDKLYSLYIQRNELLSSFE